MIFGVPELEDLGDVTGKSVLPFSSHKLPKHSQ